VAPLANRSLGGVLFIVMDGMSFPVWRELSSDLREHGWMEWTQVNGPSWQSALAVLPSATSFSRSSLLCGELICGAQNIEKRGFQEFVDFRSGKPVLFHKDEVGSSGADLSESLRLAVSKNDSKVVGVVLNVIDESDNLSEEVMKGMHEKAAQGILPARAPFGYRNDKASRTIEVHPENSAIVKRMFALYASGAHTLTSIRNRMDKAYSDKLDGKIEEDFWQRQMTEWRMEEQQVKMAIQGLSSAETGDRALDAQTIFELANSAYSLYVSQNPAEKAKLLRIVVSNFSVDAVSVYPTYRKPFDLIVKRAQKEEWSGGGIRTPDPLLPKNSSGDWTGLVAFGSACIFRWIALSDVNLYNPD
jgi:PglZ domain